MSYIKSGAFAQFETSWNECKIRFSQLKCRSGCEKTGIKIAIDIQVVCLLKRVVVSVEHFLRRL